MSILKDGETYRMLLRDRGYTTIKIHRVVTSQYGDPLYFEGTEYRGGHLSLIPWHNVGAIYREDHQSMIDIDLIEAADAPF